MTTTSFQIRQFVDGDETAVLELQNLVLTSKRTLADWKWENELNPAVRNLAVLAFAEGHNIPIGYYSAIGTNINFGGSPLLAAQPRDCIVHPDFQKQVLSQELHSAFEILAAKRGIQMIFGFPKAEIIDSDTRYRGAIGLGPTICLTRALGALNGAQSSPNSLKGLVGLICDRITRATNYLRWSIEHRAWLFRCAGKNISITQQETLPDDYEELWKEHARVQVLALWKDRKYLNWRYNQNPRSSSKYFCARLNGKLAAFAVLTHQSDIAYLSEFVHFENTSLALGRAIVLLMLLQALKWNCTRMISFSKDHGLIEAMCDRLTRESAGDLTLAEKNIVCNTPASRCAHNHAVWRISSGDLDITY